MNTGVKLNPIQSTLYGDKAFYKSSDYVEKTKKECAELNALPPSYSSINTETNNTETKIKRVAKQVFSLIFFPLTIYKIIHFVAAIPIVPAAFGISKNNSFIKRQTYVSNLTQEDVFKIKRLTIEVDGYQIDAMIMGRADTLKNGRWTLFSLGNFDAYEYAINRIDHKCILNQANSNGIFFNYPGVAASSNFINRDILIKTYQTMLKFLEDKEKGIGAKEIIGFGTSIGGAIQGQALHKYPLKPDVRYVFVKDRTLSDIKTLANDIFFGLGYLAAFLGWNIGSSKSSKELYAREIIVQTANVEKARIIKGSSFIVDDGVITPKSSLAKAILDDKNSSKDNKRIIGIPEMHTDNYSAATASAIITEITDFLDE